MPKISQEEWGTLFKAADKDHSGFLEKTELIALLKHANAPKFFSLVKAADGKEKISFEDFVQGMKSMEDVLNKMALFFQKYDINQNGYLEKKEFRIALEACGCKYDDKEFELIFQKTDVNRNGKISLEEFFKTML